MPTRAEILAVFLPASLIVGFLVVFSCYRDSRPLPLRLLSSPPAYPR